MSNKDTVLAANLALLGFEFLRTYQLIQSRLDAISRGEPLQVSDLTAFEAGTRARLDALKAKIEAAP